MLFILSERLFFVLKISNFFGHAGKRLDKKAKVNFKVYDVTNLEKVTIHILFSISKSKSNQTMKFGQSKEYIVKNIFLQISWKN